MSAYDSETEAAGRRDAVLARAEAFQVMYEVERLAEQVFHGVVGEVADQDQRGSYAPTAPRISPTLEAERSERASRRRAVLARFLGLA